MGRKKFGTCQNAVIAQNNYISTFSAIFYFLHFLQSIIFAFFTKCYFATSAKSTLLLAAQNVTLHFLQNITLQALQNLTLQNQHKIPATWIVRQPVILTIPELKCSLLPPALG